MKIELTIRRKAGSNTTVPNPDGTTTVIPFRALDASRADSPHVADVSDANAEFLLRLDPAYRLFNAPSVKAEIPPPRPATAPRVADTATPADDSADTSGNGVLSEAELKAGIKAGKFTQEALRELLEAEEVAEKPRSGFITAITKALK